MTRRLGSLRDRPASVDERRAAVLAILAVTLSSVALLGVTHDPPPRPAQPHTAAPVAPLAPHAAGAALRVAHSFLSGYLAYLYRGASAGKVSDATRALVASLADHPPRALPTQHSTPRVIELHPSGQLTVTAVLNDGGIINYTVGLKLTRLDGRLVVARVESER